MFTTGTGGKSATPSAPLGEEWQSMVEEWSQFEAQAGYGAGGFLTSKHRPAAVGQWLKRARTADWWPQSLDSSRYALEFGHWWVAMQPAWRIKDGKVVDELVEGEWGDLRVSGINGVLSVVAGLFFWGLHAHHTPPHKQQWLAAVTSFHQVLRQW